MEVEIQASRNEAIIPIDAGSKNGSGFLGRCVIYRATSPPSHDQANWHGNSLPVIFVSLACALGKHFPLGPAEQHWAVEATQDDAERHWRSRFDTGFTVQPGACLMGFVSSTLVPAHAGEAEQSMHGLKICFAAGDGNSTA